MLNNQKLIKALKKRSLEPKHNILHQTESNLRMNTQTGPRVIMQEIQLKSPIELVVWLPSFFPTDYVATESEYQNKHGKRKRERERQIKKWKFELTFRVSSNSAHHQCVITNQQPATVHNVSIVVTWHLKHGLAQCPSVESILHHTRNFQLRPTVLPWEERKKSHTRTIEIKVWKIDLKLCNLAGFIEFSMLFQFNSKADCALKFQVEHISQNLPSIWHLNLHSFATIPANKRVSLSALIWIIEWHAPCASTIVD